MFNRTKPTFEFKQRFPVNSNNIRSLTHTALGSRVALPNKKYIHERDANRVNKELDEEREYDICKCSVICGCDVWSRARRDYYDHKKLLLQLSPEQKEIIQTLKHFSSTTYDIWLNRPKSNCALWPKLPRCHNHFYLLSNSHPLALSIRFSPVIVFLYHF